MIAQRGSTAKKNAGGTLLLWSDVYVLIAGNRTKRKTAQYSVPCRGIDNRMRRRQQPCTRAQRISRALVFFLGKATHVSHALHSLEDVLVRVLFISPRSRGRWKKKSQDNNKKRTTNNSTNKRRARRPAQGGVHTAQHTL